MPPGPIRLRADALFSRLTEYMGPLPKGPVYNPNAAPDRFSLAWQNFTKIRRQTFRPEFGLYEVEACTPPGGRFPVVGNWTSTACQPSVGLINVKEWKCTVEGEPRSYQCLCDAHYPFAEWDWEPCLEAICETYAGPGGRPVEGVSGLLKRQFKRLADGCDNVQRVLLEEQEKDRLSLAPTYVVKTTTAVVVATSESIQRANSTSTTRKILSTIDVSNLTSTISTTSTTTTSTPTKAESATSASETSASETKKSSASKIPGGKATWILGGLLFSGWFLPM